MTSSPFCHSRNIYCNGGKPDVAHGAAGPAPPPAAAELTRITPVSSMQYAAVPVFKVIGPVLTENPVSPEAPQAAGTPAVSCSTPLGVYVYW